MAQPGIEVVPPGEQGGGPAGGKAGRAYMPLPLEPGGCNDNNTR